MFSVFFSLNLNVHGGSFFALDFFTYSLNRASLDLHIRFYAFCLWRFPVLPPFPVSRFFLVVRIPFGKLRHVATGLTVFSDPPPSSLPVVLSAPLRKQFMNLFGPALPFLFFNPLRSGLPALFRVIPHTFFFSFPLVPPPSP